MGQRGRSGARGDRGAAAVELTLLAPLLVCLLLFVVAAGRVTSARLAVQDAADQAARSVTVAQDPADAGERARATATAALSGDRPGCRHVTVTLTSPPLGSGSGAVAAPSPVPPVAALIPPVVPSPVVPPPVVTSPVLTPPVVIPPVTPAVVTVTVTCDLGLQDLTGLALPVSSTVTATATSPLDIYRSAP